jgi:large subunit ribosomal protein L23
MKHQNAIIKGVQVTEKGTDLAALNKYLVEVDRAANKTEIKKAVQELFNVTVLAVNTQRYKGKTKMLRNRRVIQLPDWKRAIVTLKAGDKIDVL